MAEWRIPAEQSGYSTMLPYIRSSFSLPKIHPLKIWPLQDSMQSNQSAMSRDHRGPTPLQRVVQALRRMYGKEPFDADLSQTSNEQSVQYPTGLRWYLLLLSGALPYVVVCASCPALSSVSDICWPESQVRSGWYNHWYVDSELSYLSNSWGWAFSWRCVATIIPVLVSEFESPAEIGWYASAYFLPLTVCMPLFGKCYSLWRIKWVFAGSITILLGEHFVARFAKYECGWLSKWDQ